MYANAIRILSKEHLLISLLLSSNLQEISNEGKKVIQVTNADYDIVIKNLCLHYDMKLVTFGMNNEMNIW